MCAMWREKKSGVHGAIWEFDECVRLHNQPSLLITCLVLYLSRSHHVKKSCTLAKTLRGFDEGPKTNYCVFYFLYNTLVLIIHWCARHDELLLSRRIPTSEVHWCIESTAIHNANSSIGLHCDICGSLWSEKSLPFLTLPCNVPLSLEEKKRL